MMLGEETDDWEGAKIVLHPAKVNFKGGVVDSVRIKRPAKAAA
jgi:hypothetical protein